MNYAPTYRFSIRQGGLFGISAALHAGILLAIVATATLPPRTLEIPMVVDLLQPQPEPLAAEAKPVSTPVKQPVRKEAAPATKTAVRSSEQPATVAMSAGNASANDIAASAEPASHAPAEPMVTQARFDADYLKNPAPPYPPLSKRMGETGQVVLRVHVSAEGTAESVEIRTSSGATRLDEAARNTVKNWRFVPARKGNVVVASVVLVPIIFKLEQ